MSNKNKQKELKEVLKRYVNNEATVSESEAVDRWYDTLGYESSKDKRSIDVEQVEVTTLKPFRKHLFWAAAASLILVAFSTFWFINKTATSSIEDTIIRSAQTERKEITLSDGTEVILNTGSELLVKGNFGVNQRRVVLKGEAYFKVAKNAEIPFIIQSGQLSTTVLGTAFNISAYPDRDRMKVSVLSGRVSVSQSTGKSEKILANQMTANETISFFRKTGKSELNKEDAKLITSWRDNKLYIDNASIQDIAELLNGYYHMEVNNLIEDRHTDRYTIRFNQESMNGVLQILSRLTSREFIYTNHQINIKQKMK